MKSTNITAMTTTFETGLTTVYTNAAYTVVPNSLNSFTLSTPFAWDGTSNIIVGTCFQNTTWNGSQNIEYTATSYNASLTYVVDGAACANTTGTTSVNRPNITFGGQVGTNLTANYNWAWSPTTATNTATTTAVVTAGAGTYTVTATNATTGCFSTSQVDVIINTPLGAPTDANGGSGTTAAPYSSVQCGSAVPTLAVSGSGTSFRWYTVATGGTPIAGTTATYGGPAITVSQFFYVSQIAANGCEGARVALYAYVADPDPIAVATSSSSICLGEAIVLSATKVSSVNGNPYAYTWAATPSAGSGIATTLSASANPVTGNADNVTVTPTVAGAYTYSVTADEENCLSLIQHRRLPLLRFVKEERLH
jgi:hypothetical protein